jgi:hypothetical protein
VTYATDEIPTTLMPKQVNDGKLLVDIHFIWGFTYIVDEDVPLFLGNHPGQDWRVIAQSSHLLLDPEDSTRYGIPCVVMTMGRYEAV